MKLKKLVHVQSHHLLSSPTNCSPEPSSPSASSSSMTTVSLFFQHRDAQERGGAVLYFTHFMLKYLRNNLICIALEKAPLCQAVQAQSHELCSGQASSVHQQPPGTAVPPHPAASDSAPSQQSKICSKCCGVNPTGPH